MLGPSMSIINRSVLLPHRKELDWSLLSSSRLYLVDSVEPRERVLLLVKKVNC